jgi:hypothetical protein
MFAHLLLTAPVSFACTAVMLAVRQNKTCHVNAAKTKPCCLAHWVSPPRLMNQHRIKVANALPRQREARRLKKTGVRRVLKNPAFTSQPFGAKQT